MFIVFFCLFILSSFELQSAPFKHHIVTSTKRIILEKFPDSFNPSIIKVDEGFILTFRYCPDRTYKPWLSYIGVVLLNESFEFISEPQLLDSRVKKSNIPSQSEDARIFSYNGKLYLIFNDSDEVFFPQTFERRDMYMAELHYENGQFTLSPSLKLVYGDKYHAQLWQKNWIPFEWNNSLMFSYSLNPHEVIHPNLVNGFCYPGFESQANINWNYGRLRGSTPPLLVDGEYLAFFHSGIVTTSESSWHIPMWHYYMGAYTFSASPPFKITKISPYPIIGDEFYTKSHHEKRVIFPGGFVVTDSSIYVAYGKDDFEIWIATIDRKALKKSLVFVPSN